MPTIWIIFFTGLVAGGVSCTAVQGGLLALAIGQTGMDKTAGAGRTMRNVWTVSAFVFAKLFSYTLLGGLLGFIGGSFLVSARVTTRITIAVSFLMIGLGITLLDIHPLFRRLSISPPKFVRRFIWNQKKRSGLMAPVILGALTVFIPCGVTQAMMVLAIGYGSPLAGAYLLFVYTLGTIPLFILLGILFSALRERFRTWFTRAAGIMVIGIALWNVLNVARLYGWDRSLEKFIRPAVCQIVYCEESPDSVGISDQTRTNPNITIRKTSYEIDNPMIPAGKGITVTLKNIDATGCIQFFTIPSLNIQLSVPPGTTKTIVFTAPKEPGELVYGCSMGMYRGFFSVR